MGFVDKRVEAIFLNEEAVIDVELLKSQLIFEMKETSVNSIFNCEVISAEKKFDKWILKDNNDNKMEFDYVIGATYGQSGLKILDNNRLILEKEYHKTMVLEVSLNNSKIGVTVIDGDFITVLPKANEYRHLIYAPGPSVLARIKGKELPVTWNNFNLEQMNKAEDSLIKRYESWFPTSSSIKVHERLITTRAIETGVKETDRRVSLVEQVSENFFEVCSGKIDHCIEIAQEVLLKVCQSALTK